VRSTGSTAGGSDQRSSKRALQRTSHGVVEVIGVRLVEECEIDPCTAGFLATLLAPS
jgi:hypothetical protein